MRSMKLTVQTHRPNSPSKLTVQTHRPNSPSKLTVQRSVQTHRPKKCPNSPSKVSKLTVCWNFVGTSSGSLADKMARYEACIGWLGIAPIPRSPGTWLNPHPPGPQDPDPVTVVPHKGRGAGGRLTCGQPGRLEEGGATSQEGGWELKSLCYGVPGAWLQVINPEIVSGSLGWPKRGLPQEGGEGSGERDIVIERKGSSETVGEGPYRCLMGTS
jgi:hypothetical protein